MDRSQHMREGYERINDRNFENAGGFAKDLKFHAPGIPLDTEGYDAVIEGVRRFVDRTDARYEVLETADLGPFTVGHVRATGTVAGTSVSWEILQVARWDGDEVTEMWSLRA
jgi:hypothetical protein